MPLLRAIVATFAVIVGLAGCASYRAEPLPRSGNLVRRLADLDLQVPGGTGDPSRTIDWPLTLDQIGLLAILNDPELKSERGTLDVARAGLLQATLLPNPSANLGYGALIGGPGTASSIAASLSQDIAAIVTRSARVASVQAHLGAGRRRPAVARMAGRPEGASARRRHRSGRPRDRPDRPRTSAAAA